MQTPGSLPHVVVLGGGFAGMAVCRRLRGAPVRITLIDRRNHHLFQPLLYQVATAGLAAPEIAAPLRLDTAEEIAAAHRARGALGLPGGQLIANPPPIDAEISATEIAPLIDAALARAAKTGVGGKAVTPFLLAEILAATGGRSLETNIALYLNNCRLAAEIAKALARAR